MLNTFDATMITAKQKITTLGDPMCPVTPNQIHPEGNLELIPLKKTCGTSVHSQMSHS